MLMKLPGGIVVDRRRRHTMIEFREATEEEVGYARTNFNTQATGPPPDGEAYYFVHFVCGQCGERIAGVVTSAEKFGTTCRCYRMLQHIEGRKAS